jgi:three-Cys-motif partner protein
MRQSPQLCQFALNPYEVALCRQMAMLLACGAMNKNHYHWKIGERPPTLGQHSLAKHRILDRYIRRYIEICTSTPVQEKLNLTIVDGYCGGGRYTFLDGEVPGSPLIILSAIAEMEQLLNKTRPKGFEIRTNFVFIDLHRYHTEFLRAEIEASPFKDRLDKSIFIWTADFNERVADAIARVRLLSPTRGRSIWLLDQYGWSDVAFGSMRRILGELEKAEIFLTFSGDSLIDYMSEKRLEQRGYREIDLDPSFIAELTAEKGEGPAWRTLIQNTLYSHLIEKTGAEFYSPFFIHSPEAHRSYWFLHLSRHREARNVIGNIHWEENTISLHHGGAGLQALGFVRHADPRQMSLSYAFDEHALDLSRTKLMDQIPQLIRSTIDADLAPSLEMLFGKHCNDTPVTREIFERVLLELRDEKEVVIEDANGILKPRAQSVAWTDRIALARQRNFFGRFGL